MFENFDTSEKYRKYLIELQLADVKLYTVWGTDMIDDENDKLLVNQNKLIVFKNLDLLQTSIKVMPHPFMDRRNFEKWVNEEDLKQVYNTNNLQLLADFHVDFLKEKSLANEILNCLNLIQDFFIQINADDFDEIYENDSIVDLKDFIYNNFFWKPATKNPNYKELENTNINDLLKELYLAFCDKMEIIQ